MRVIRAKKCAVIALIVFTLVYKWIPVKKQIPSPGIDVSRVACRHPELDLYSETVFKLVDLGDLTCETEEDWLFTRKGYIHFNPNAVRKHGKITCRLTYLIRNDDFNVIGSNVFMVKSDTGPTRLEEDFFKALCTATDNSTWHNLMAGVRRNEAVALKARDILPPRESMKLNVLFLGLDSLSRVQYMQKLPKTVKYLSNVLNATVLNGYNIVGEGIPQALIPILTGYAAIELPETRRRVVRRRGANSYPFLWKNFISSGYITAFGEDDPSIGTFSYQLESFKEKPTHHYMHQFYLQIDKEMEQHSSFCLGNTPRHRVMLNYLRDIYDVYSDIPKFTFVFLSELSHFNYNLIGYADSDIQGFLKNLKKDGILNETLLIMMSNHGYRFANIRQTMEGKQEHRMPFFSIAVPAWFKKKYPDAMKNLRLNADRLVTPFDIHPTILTVLNTDVPKIGKLSNRGISLFSEIPKERTCQDAGVEPHWCACLSWHQLPLTDHMRIKAGQAVIDFVNDLTASQRKQCAPFVLYEVSKSEKLLPTKELLKFGQITNITEILYHVQIRAYPGKAVYEVFMKYIVPKRIFHIRQNDISRVDIYIDHENYCVHDTHPRLREYCFCKVRL